MWDRKGGASTRSRARPDRRISVVAIADAAPAAPGTADAATGAFVDDRALDCCRKSGQSAIFPPMSCTKLAIQGCFREDVKVLLSFTRFLRDENGAITIDYTVLSAAAVSIAVAATAVLTGSIDHITQRIDEELRARQLNDSYISFLSSHFEPLYQHDVLTEEQAEDLWNASNALMNQEVIDALEEGIMAIEEGTITQEELAELYSVASVAYQRNIVDDSVLNYYFGFDGSGSGGS
jgi:Flp pilus assembly pilin Flp